MAKTVISAKYPPLIDPTRTPIAYGDRALPRLNRELNDSELLTRQRALMSLCDYLHDPEHIASALKEGIPLSLKNLLKDKDVTCRHKALECLFVIGTHAIGRDSFLEHGIIKPVAELFEDGEDICRRNAHQAMEIVSENPIGAAGVVEAGLVPKLVLKLKTEMDEMKELILDTLHFCLRVDTEQALKAEAMNVFTELLDHTAASIRYKAARDIMDLSVPLAGKDKAVAVGCVPRLVQLLADDDEHVRANAAGAIMTIAITTKGKYTSINANAIPALVTLVDDSCSEVRANALKALTCLAEAPEGRQALLKDVDKIKLHISDHIPAVGKAANIAVEVITWKP